MNLGEFIDAVLLGDLRRMILEHGLHYLGFGVVADGIEFLGACLDDASFDERGRSERRFNGAILDLFPLQYHAYAEPDSPYYLYRHLRCGMAHIMRPQGKVTFTSEPEAEHAGIGHLSILPGQDKLVLVSEAFYRDFHSAALKVRDEMAEGLHSKHVKDEYLPITAGPGLAAGAEQACPADSASQG